MATSALPIELVLPDGADPAALIRLLTEQFDVTEDRASRADRTFLDTFDRRLRAAGLVLERRRSTLTLLEPGAPPRTADMDRAGNGPDRLLASELPPGPLRARLAPVLDMRALLPEVRVRSRIRTLRVRNADDKTVVRLSLELPEVVVRGHDPVPLAARLIVTPVRGYERALARVVASMHGRAGLPRAQRTLVDQAVAASRPLTGSEPPPFKPATQPSAPADHAALAVCRSLADVVDANLPGTLDDLDTEFLHDLRVAVRRTRSVLREMKGALPPQDRERFRNELRWVQQVTGPTRDLDVQLLEWPDFTAAVPPAAAADLAPLRDLLAARRTAAFRAMGRSLRGKRFRESWAAWRAFLDQPLGAGSTRPIRDVAAERIVTVHRSMIRQGRTIDDTSPDEELHDLRKRGKELRYLLELFGDLFSRAVVKDMVVALKGLQDVLGRFQDRATQATFLRELGPELAALPRGPDALLALGGVIDRLVADQDEARRAFAQRFAVFAAPDQRAMVKATFPR
ncbi:MAG: CHAD domain-containing protein [Acidimicrobiales bacterium]